jgi:hypothetical protein
MLIAIEVQIGNRVNSLRDVSGYSDAYSLKFPDHDAGKPARAALLLQAGVLPAAPAGLECRAAQNSRRSVA